MKLAKGVGVTMKSILLALGFLLVADTASAMSYRVVTLDNGRCTGACPQAVAAEGAIQLDELERLAGFLQQLGTVPRVVALHSPGGNLAGALKLGYGLRRLGIKTVVARVSHTSPARVGTGICASACVYTLMGGVARVVPPGSRLVVHAAQRRGGLQRDIAAGGYMEPTTDSGAVLGLLHNYAVNMGVDPSLMSLAQSVPHESARALSAAEINRFRLARVPPGGARKRR
jgi:hypothetical protein